MSSKDPFSIDIILRHPFLPPDQMSRALSITPLLSRAAMRGPGGLQKKRNYVYARLQKGDRSSQFETALANVVSLLQRNEEFWADFKSRCALRNLRKKQIISWS
jgi:hypothetical protein